MSYTYDHSGSRVKSVNAATGEETVYINQYMELRDGEPVYYIFAGGTRVASLQDDNSGTGTLEITYLHQDHLGGTALATDSDGLVVQLYDYYPFGTQLEDASYGDSEVEVNHSFTDKEFEEELGLYYFEARWYDSRIGQFATADPLGLIDPMARNLYAYANGNPIIFIDPTGLDSALVIYGANAEGDADYFQEKAEDYASTLDSSVYDDGIGVIDGSEFENWQDALGEYKDISLITYYGHGYEEGLVYGENYESLIVTGEVQWNNSSQSYDHYINELNTENVVDGATILLFSCHSATNNIAGQNSVAQEFANHFNGYALGANGGVSFNGFMPEVNPIHADKWWAPWTYWDIMGPNN